MLTVISGFVSTYWCFNAVAAFSIMIKLCMQTMHCCNQLLAGKYEVLELVLEWNVEIERFSMSILPQNNANYAKMLLVERQHSKQSCNKIK